MTFFPSYPLLAVALVLLASAALVAARSRGGPDRSAGLRRVLLALLLIVVAARPMVGSTSVVTYSSGVDVVIMIDRTTSMAAEDHDGGRPRLDGVREDLTRVIDSVAGSRFAVVVFDNEARVALPFTTDSGAALSVADAVGYRESVYGSGSDISLGVPQAVDLLERSRSERPDVGRYVVYVGDGEQTAATEPGSFSDLQPLVDGGLVLGYGTDAGGPMRVQEGSDEYVMVDGQPARSRIDEGNLLQIAETLGVPYEHRTDGSSLELAVTDAVQVPNEQREPRGHELYWIAAALAVVVLGIDVWNGLGRLRRAREELR